MNNGNISFNTIKKNKTLGEFLPEKEEEDASGEEGD